MKKRKMRKKMNKATVAFLGSLGLLFALVLCPVAGLSYGNEVPVPRPAGDEGLTVVIEAENVRDENISRAIRYDLPEGIEPAHLMDKAEFMIKHDPGTGNFFLEKDVAFSPGETKYFRIKVENIWEVPENLVTIYMDNARDVLRMLEGTRHESEARSLYQRIRRRGEAILSSQKEARTMAEYISAGRANRDRMEGLTEDLRNMQDLYEPGEEKEPPGEDLLLTVLELAILISSFILIVTIVFFIIWYNRIK